MGNNVALGDKGQKHAEDYLQQAGYAILATGYRRQRCEIDIIARKDTYTVFIEVKTRRSLRYGAPREAVTPAKQRHIIQAAWAYVAEQGLTGDMRFDVIEVIVSKQANQENQNEYQIEHLANAFQLS